MPARFNVILCKDFTLGDVLDGDIGNTFCYLLRYSMGLCQK